MNVATELESLNESLSDFGLCPAEWTITEEDTFLFKIENIEEPQFYFKGNIKVEDGRRKWGSISLAGL